MCVWIDDADSIFNIKKLLKCGVDTSKWADFWPESGSPIWRSWSLGRIWPSTQWRWCKFCNCCTTCACRWEISNFVTLSMEWTFLCISSQSNSRPLWKIQYDLHRHWCHGRGLWGLWISERVCPPCRHCHYYQPEVKAGMVLKVHDLVDHGKLSGAKAN